MFTLVSTTTKDKLKLSGLLSQGDKTKPVILHIHGFEGDFYTNSFINPITETLKKQNSGFFTVQTRGTGSDYLFLMSDNSWKRYGSHFELLHEAYQDIDAWIEFLIKDGYTNIILQGHSLGTIKAVRYLFEGTQKDVIKKLILIAPFDKNAIIQKSTHGKWKEYVAQAKKKVAEGKGEELIPPYFDETETPYSYQTYVSWFDESDLSNVFDFHNKSYTFHILNKITIPTKILVGTKDEYFHWSNPDHPEEAIEILTKNIKHSSGKLFENAHHGFNGFEGLLAKEIVTFLNE